MIVKIKRPLMLLLLSATAGFAQAGDLETQEQRFSYTLGYQFAQQLKGQHVNVDGAAFGAALDDVLQGKKLQLTTEQMKEAMTAGRQAAVASAQKAKQEQGKQAAEDGRKFLEENKTKDGVTELPSGLQYMVLKAGEGESPKADDTVTVHYRGTLINGKEFDSSYGRGKPTSFSLGGVIPGFRESISLMKPGAKWKVFIPSKLGYGLNGAGSAIGPNETLIFEIELLSIGEDKKG
ncbi:MAG: FKBP-type peptidyl-prolyl cis-trans isomerase [Candidatus Sedimenticola sp. 6PFRAG5]